MSKAPEATRQVDCTYSHFAGMNHFSGGWRKRQTARPVVANHGVSPAAALLTTPLKQLLAAAKRNCGSRQFPYGIISLNFTEKLRSTPGNDVWLVIAFVSLVFVLGGGGRADIASLVFLRPLAALTLAYGLVKFEPRHLRDYRALFVISAAIVVLSVVHLIPLPPALWTALPGREIVEQIDAAAGLTGVWRPISLVPQDGLNALFALMIPFAALFMSVRLSNAEHRRLAYLLIILAFTSILLGLLQLQGSARGPLYFYRITNEGKMVGLFSNRNHNAIFLSTIIPVCAYLASLPVRDLSRLRLRAGLSLIGAGCILAALVVIGSRAGFAFGVLGSFAAIAIYQKPMVFSRSHSDPKRPFALAKYGKIAGVAAVMAIAVGLSAFSQSETMQRVQTTEPIEEQRLMLIEPLLHMSWTYFPVGSGIGSFVEAYKIGEPLDLLDPTYLNHAHNDLLEVLLTAGLPGVALIVIAGAIYAVAAVKVFGSKAAGDENLQRARLGAMIVGLLALASLVDYPLRTPSLACLFVIASVWLRCGLIRFDTADGTSRNA